MKYLIACIKFFLLLCVFTVSAKKCKGKGDGGIIGGTKATRGELPWQILLYNTQASSMCGGSIISPRHILTAGHCIMNSDDTGKVKPSELQVFGGVLNREDLNNKDVQMKSVKAIHTNDKIWQPAHAKYELTILTLASNFTWTDAVKEIRYANKDDPTDLDGEEVIASGWGTIDTYGAGGTISNDLLWTKMDVSKCEQNFGQDDLFCARGSNGENVCSGDSGGPIVCKDAAAKNYLCGYSSMSYCENGQSQLGRVNFYNDFIKKAMSKP